MEFKYFIKQNNIWKQTSRTEFEQFDGEKKVKIGLITQYFNGNEEVGYYNMSAMLAGFRY